jgi:hypothetical protein
MFVKIRSFKDVERRGEEKRDENYAHGLFPLQLAKPGEGG